MSCKCKKQNCEHWINNIITACEQKQKFIQEDLARINEDEEEERFDMLCIGVLAVIVLILSCAGAIIIST